MSRECGGLLKPEKDKLQQFASPNWPGGYGRNLFCEWVLRVDPGEAVMVKFVDFELQDSTDCKEDNVVIYSGEALTKLVHFSRLLQHDRPFCDHGTTNCSKRHIYNVKHHSHVSDIERPTSTIWQHPSNNQPLHILQEICSSVSLTRAFHTHCCFVSAFLFPHFVLLHWSTECSETKCHNFIPTIYIFTGTSDTGEMIGELCGGTRTTPPRKIGPPDAAIVIDHNEYAWAPSVRGVMSLTLTTDGGVENKGFLGEYYSCTYN